MCRASLIALSFAFLMTTGCLNQKESRVAKLRTSLPTSGDAAYIDYLIVERPTGDTYLNSKMWKDIDEMVIPIDARPVARSNGFRVGVIGGLISQDVQTLIANPKSQQEIRRRQTVLGVAKPLNIGGVIPNAEFNVTALNDDQSKSFKLDQVQCDFQVTAWEGEGGKVRVEFIPEVVYHDKKHWIPPGAVGAGWLREKPVERFNDLTLEVPLSPSEYVILGTKFESEGTLGHKFFMGETKQQRVQRILILRAGKMNQSLPLGDFFHEDTLKKSDSKAVPLALQASTSTPRATRE